MRKGKRNRWKECERKGCNGDNVDNNTSPESEAKLELKLNYFNSGHR